MPDIPDPLVVGALDVPPDVLAALRAAGRAVVEVSAGDGAGGEAARRLADRTGVVVVGGPPGERVAAARAAVDAGAHAFLMWPPGVSADESAALARRADEAGVEVGVARPLPTADLLAGVPPGWTSRLMTLDIDVTPAGTLAERPQAHRLAGALSLCAALAGSDDPARVDAATQAGLTAITLRFRTGAYAHVALRDDAPAERFALVAAGTGATVEAQSLAGPLRVAGQEAVVRKPEAEVEAFVTAIVARRPLPFSLDDAVATMRLAERVLARLR